MTLTEMFTICDSCVYAPCLCGNDPENCVAYVMRTSCGSKMDGGAETVTITLSEYRELVVSSMRQRDYIDQIDDLKEGMDYLCQLVLEAKPDLATYVIAAGKAGVPLSALEALLRFAKDGDADA